MGRRIRWLAIALVVCFAAVLAQLVNIQLREATRLNASPQNQRNAAAQLDNRRGDILASDGTVLAQSVKVASPPSADPFQYKRVYTTGPLYSGIVGYSSPAYYGTSGAEYAYNTFLGLHKKKVTTLGQLLNPPATTTDSVSLTVVPSLQKLAQQELMSIPDTRKDGAITVLSVKTSAVLAMYSSPTYTNNALATPTPKKDEAAGKADRTTPDHEGFYPYPPLATYGAFAPGSTFKVVTTTAVYNLKPTLAHFSFKTAGCTAKNAIPQTTKVICNDATTPQAANPCGGTMYYMLPQSCDPGYAMLGLAVGRTDLYKQAELFGYNQKPPIDLTPYVVSKSNFPTPAELAPTGRLGPPGLALSAFGQQTVTATDLEDAMVAEGIANKGDVMTPHVMSQIHDETGKLIESYKPSVYKHAATATAAADVSRLMQRVVTTPKGTAAGVGFPAQWDIAVKTGTAQAGAGNTNTTDWMIGFAPAYDPVVAIAVVVPYQARTASGATIAGPIMKAMMGAALSAVPHTGNLPTTTTTAPPATTTTSSTATTVPPTTAPPLTAPTTTQPPPTTTSTTTPPPPATLPGTAAGAAGHLSGGARPGTRDRRVAPHSVEAPPS